MEESSEKVKSYRFSFAGGQHASSHVSSHSLPKGYLLDVINVCILLAVLLVIDYTSPLHQRFVALGDSDIFTLAGKIWAEGGIPYVDYWDHKGPLIFFTNLLGAWLGDNGVFWVDFVLLVVSMVIFRHTATILSGLSTVFRQEIITLVTMAWVIRLLQPGMDMTETVCLPFLAASLYTMLLQLNNFNRNNNYNVFMLTAFVQGLAFAACLMTRVTNGVAVCTATLILTVIVCAHAQWRNLLICIVSFIVGFAVLVAPFSIYFGMHGSFGDMVYATITYNLSYAQGSTGGIYAGIIITFLIFFVPLAMILMSIFSMICSRTISVIDGFVLITGIAFAALYIRSEPYQHYAVVSAVFIPLLASQLYSLEVRRMPIVLKKTTDMLMIVVFVLLACSSAALCVRDAERRPVYENPTVEQLANLSNNNIVIYDRSDSSSAIAYLKYGITPAYRFANLQEWQGSFSEQYRTLLLKEFSTNKAEYIVVSSPAGQSTESKPLIQPILDDDYTRDDDLSSADDSYVVWRRNDVPER